MPEAETPKRKVGAHWKIWWEDLDRGDVNYEFIAKYAKEHSLAPVYTVELAPEASTKITRGVIENHDAAANRHDRINWHILALPFDAHHSVIDGDFASRMPSSEICVHSRPFVVPVLSAIGELIAGGDEFARADTAMKIESAAFTRI